jgi:PAS domain S-box-containing protein
MGFFKQLLSSDFMPHGFCYLWDPRILWLHVISDGLIVLSYYCIPIILIYFIRKNRELPFNGIFWMFGTFTLACGTTHLMEIWNVWHGSYLIAGVIKAITAAVSVVTALMLIPLLPKAISLPGQVHAQEQKYRRIFDEAIVSIFQSTPGGRFLSVNPVMARTFGYDSPEEMIASITDIARQFFINAKRRDELILLMESLGSVQDFEFEVFHKDGSKMWVSATVRAVRENGVMVRYEGMYADITERKFLRDQLLQAQKLESIGQLAAGIAHEINTPAQYIGSNVLFLKDAFQDLKSLLANYERLLTAAQGNTLSGEALEEVSAAVEHADLGYLFEEIPKAIEQTLEGVTRVSTLVGAMKEFSQPGTKEKMPLDLNHAIESTIAVASNEWKNVANLETEFDPSLPLVSCLPGEFNQVILNLILNAAHAIADVVGKGGSEKGTIRVQTRNCPEWVEIRIQDTGAGIPEKVQGRIFDPFFTTKEVGQGTGQGLAIARSVVVDKHAGSIHFETEEGKGTTFIIRLPHDGKALAAKAVSV